MKSGFAVLVGRSNVGKSTLLNALVGTKVAITSPKPQTTRHQVHGIVTDPRGQIVFVDTPGVFEQAHNRLTKQLNDTARSALSGVDVIIYVADPTRAVGNEEHILLRMVEKTRQPKILAINKTDVRNPPFISEYRDLGDRFGLIIEISALRKRALKDLISAVFERLPEGDPYYPEFQFSNLEHRFWLSEVIREKVFVQMGAEIPYSTAVEIEEIEERKSGSAAPVRYIKAVILTTNPKHKQMLIGSGARKIKEIGWAARKELEAILDTKIFLDLRVEVDERWMDRLAGPEPK
ncbi:GTPase Era [Candidatus Uhrbacteria bacterium RIFCSPHIGHO2_12_FULL_57_11]|uniref:GTPase Era n=2 Tax=Candidatus Uhriibacteriota TaxID=1752732 RepID=A0A1F7ULU3_9BACT|nr:MAG: GTPase Era [Candidatus Uhrbacteria bacterium RIFCSPHIGHO2_02_FULL_57_19]OGL78667.1 MAG: GTPase Era [Candidatus Uhrbacteria bacterium RIFCSPHIGHO2_12_FULL_57_11]